MFRLLAVAVALCASALLCNPLAAADQPKLAEFTGKISALDAAAKSVTVVAPSTTKDGAPETRTFAIDEKTEVRVSNKPATAQQLAADLWAIVAYDAAAGGAKPTAVKIRAMKNKPDAGGDETGAKPAGEAAK